MNTIIRSITLLFLLTVGANNSFAQEKAPKTATAEFEVSGVCDMCETRIEAAALIKGVKLAEWNKEKQQLKVIYSTKKTDEEAIKKAVAKAGHDTDKVKATEEDYKKLPGCCAYRDGVEVH